MPYMVFAGSDGFHLHRVDDVKLHEHIGVVSPVIIPLRSYFQIPYPWAQHHSKQPQGSEVR